jgi:penicillin-insensitive murein endopeptidase
MWPAWVGLAERRHRTTVIVTQEYISMGFDRTEAARPRQSCTDRGKRRSVCFADRLFVAARRIGPRIWKQASFLLFMVFLWGPCPVWASTCYGTVGNGRLAEGVQLPIRGENFAAYSQVGVELGRTYIHSTVRQVVLDAYAGLAKTAPDKTYVYGETGFVHGGPIHPHRTHQAGLSVDFMVPVMVDANRSVPLPATPWNKFGYGLEFDDQGRIPGMRIDFYAMAEHLYQLSVAAHRHGVTIERVIFDPPLIEKLFSSSRRGAELRRILPFMKARPWIRHDEHYHIDFGIPCLPVREYREK